MPVAGLFLGHTESEAHRERSKECVVLAKKVTRAFVKPMCHLGLSGFLSYNQNQIVSFSFCSGFTVIILDTRAVS